MVKSEKEEVKTEIKKPKFSIDAILKSAKKAYGKDEQGTANLLATGKTIPKPSKDSDYVVWSYNNFWQQLTGLRGIPFGRICQIAGKADSGKSSLAGCFMKAAQDQGYLVILWDSERKFNAKRFDEKIGGSSEDLIVVNTNGIIDGAKAIAHIVNSAKEQNPSLKILLVWDSVGASVNSSEDSEDNEDYSKQPGMTAKEVSWAIRKFNKLAAKYFDKATGEEAIATLVINQVYQTIGQPIATQVEKGGVELTYLSSIILQLSRKKDLVKTKNGMKIKYGIESRAKVKKNHIFDGEDCVAELDIAVSADGVHLAKEIKESGVAEDDDGGFGEVA